MANVIRIMLPAATPSATVLAAGVYGAGAVLRVQWSATEIGTFADLTGTGSTPTVSVVSGIETYQAEDPDGTSSSWYRSRIENSGATRVSDWSHVRPVVYS